MPKGSITKSVMTPDDLSYAVGSKLQLPMLAGDALLWTLLDTERREGVEACAKVAPDEPSALDHVAKARAAVLQER